MASKKIKTERLENGLTVHLLEMHHLPVVCTLLCYSLGARDEGRGETGLSHFLEHMMFKGTKRLKRGAIDAITAGLGGMNNAMTGQDFTCYLFRVASHNWEKVLEIEADRMRGCLILPDEFNREKKVVIEELHMGLDDPWSRLYHDVESAAFQVHPYHHPVIGWEEDIQRVTRDEMYSFYRRNYGPDRATLILVGDIDASSAMEAVKRRFGRIKPIGTERPFAPKEPVQNGIRNMTLYSPGRTARLAFAYKGVKLSDSNEPVFDMLSAIMGGGRASRLYKRLVKGEELASSVAVYNESRLDPGLFWILVDIKEGSDPESVKEIVFDEVDKISKRAPGKREIERARARLESALYFGKEETYGLAMRIGDYAMSADLKAMNQYPAIIAGSTGEQIKAAAAEVLREEKLTQGLSLPSGPGGAGAGGGHDSVPRLRRWWFRRGEFHFPKIKRRVLANNLTALAVRMRQAPVVSVSCSIDAGMEFEERFTAGLGNLVGATLAEGTLRRSGEALAETVESMGGFLSTGAEGVALRALARDFPKALSLLDEIVRKPAFPEDAINRMKAIIGNEIYADMEQPRTRALLAFKKMVFGDHPLSLPTKGFLDSLANIERGHLLAWHKRLFKPDKAIIAVAGDMDPGRALDEVERRFCSWRGRAIQVPELPDLVLPKRPMLEEIPMDREQIHIYMGHLGVKRTDPDFYSLLVMDHILGTGPGFTDRISKRLRDEMGLAYTVNASISASAGKLPGYFSAYIGTSLENKRAALEGMKREMKEILRTPALQSEVSAVKDYLTGSYFLGLEQSIRVCRFLTNVERFSLGLDYLERYPSLIRSQTPRMIMDAAKRHLHPDRLVTAVAGPVKGKK